MKKFFYKNFLMYLIITILSLLLIPICFTKKFKIEKAVIIENTQNNMTEINYDIEEKPIKLLHKSDNSIEELGLEEYLINVVSGEMPVDYEFEALKAQAIVARTYTLYQIENSKKHENADICDDSNCCQAWVSKEKRFERWQENQEEKWEKIKDAVYSCAGEIITYEGKPIDAFFHSNSGGKTEIPINVWGGSNFPYLQVVETVGEDEYSQYYSEREFTLQEVEKKMKDNYKDFSINWNDNDAISILEYTESSRIKTIKIGNKNISGVEARKIFELKSSNFTFEKNGTNIKFKVIGYGHGVGLSQTGSNTLAKQGKNYEEIINYYYKDVKIEKIKNN